eukprot:CAMPEP_0180756188 /NCGR_PEP_ID=MMETSP1038_2-20121128/34098_1 /TAXON_ID=632150 /ORGANISM="Azadinium spinosum, Strain 3D9" /LENGTH=270 /DNA_ID=CAMNT_0022790155 /DNA_START=81 /DNA_END=894 /DNA_ORIENTATION=-
MEASDSCRTIRLGPGELLCRRCPDSEMKVWTCTFDVVLHQTLSSFVNIGLVEWVATVQDERKHDAGEGGQVAVGAVAEVCEPEAEDSQAVGKQNQGDCSSASCAASMGNGVATLAELLGVVPGAEVEDKAVTWQHTSESPRQMMLGCRKGVKWYGNKCSEPVFKDDLCAGSLLHFRCDYFFDEDGEATQVRLWLLPSPAAFRRTGRRVAAQRASLRVAGYQGLRRRQGACETLSLGPSSDPLLEARRRALRLARFGPRGARSGICGLQGR